VSASRPAPERLPPAESENVLFQLFRTQQAIRPLMAEAVEGTGVSPDEYGVLGVIGFLGPITPTELARRLGMAPTTVSVYAARFLERGHARRLPNPRDGRSYLLEVTDEGRQIVHTIAPRINVAIEKLRAAADRPLRDIFDALLAMEDAARRATASEAAAVDEGTTAA
jgi:DNA-binding MarR family transcriptional regulator